MKPSKLRIIIDVVLIFIVIIVVAVVGLLVNF